TRATGIGRNLQEKSTATGTRLRLRLLVASRARDPHARAAQVTQVIARTRPRDLSDTERARIRLKAAGGPVADKVASSASYFPAYRCLLSDQARAPVRT